MVSDDKIEAAAEKLLDGKPLTRAEERLLYSPQGDFAMGQVRAILKARRLSHIHDVSAAAENRER